MLSVIITLALPLLQCAEQADIYPLGNFIFNIVGQDLSSSGASCCMQLPLPEGCSMHGETPNIVSHAAASLQPGACMMSQSRQVLILSYWPHLSTQVLMHMNFLQTHAMGIRVPYVRAQKHVAVVLCHSRRLGQILFQARESSRPT